MPQGSWSRDSLDQDIRTWTVPRAECGDGPRELMATLTGARSSASLRNEMDAALEHAGAIDWETRHEG